MIEKLRYEVYFDGRFNFATNSIVRALNKAKDLLYIGKYKNVEIKDLEEY